jgi:hypothetical protein
MPSPVYPSSVLLAANARLGQLRADYRQQAVDSSQAPVKENGKPTDLVPAATVQSLALSALPAHLGWGSAAITRLLRSHLPSQKPAEPPILSAAQAPAVTVPTKTTAAPKALKIYPTLAAAILREQMTSAARVWFLLRMLDTEGRGWVSFEDAQEALVGTETVFHLFGKRHFRRLLQQGRGIFWERDKERLWLRSLAKVAVALNVTQLQGYRVMLPLSKLSGPLGDFRAHLYSVVHGGRQRELQRKPISRVMMTTITGLSRRTQRSYEVRAKVRVQANQAIGERWTEAGWREACWRHGPAAFEFVDYLGKMGPIRQRYIAWQLPNNYLSPLKPGGVGRKRQLNKQIADLRMKRGAGNGNRQRRRYFSSGKDVAYELRRGTAGRVYWPGPVGIWFSRKE